MLLQRIVKAAHTVDAGQRALDPLDDDDIALAAKRLQKIAGGLETEAVIVGANEGHELAAGGAVGDVDDGNIGRVDLLDARYHGLVVDRDEDDGVRLLDHDVLDLAELLGNAVGL